VQMFLVGQLIGGKVTGGVSPRVGYGQGQKISSALILPNIPQGLRSLPMFLKHRHQDSVSLADGIG